jgi:hypothetical protein
MSLFLGVTKQEPLNRTYRYRYRITFLTRVNSQEKHHGDEQKETPLARRDEVIVLQLRYRGYSRSDPAHQPTGFATYLSTAQRKGSDWYIFCRLMVRIRLFIQAR